MPKRTRKIDTLTPGVPRQLSLFDIVLLRDAQKSTADKTSAGACNIAQPIRKALVESIQASGLSRAVIAERMSELLSIKINALQLDCWTAASKNSHRFPAEYAAAFCVVTGRIDLLQVMAGPTDCYVLESQKALRAEIGQIEEQIAALAARRKEIRKYIAQTQRGVSA